MPDQSFRSIRKPVRQADADHLILLMLLSFAASVVVTRVFLQLTGFPKIGGGESGLHIAHVLWGGLLLFTGTLLPLIFANRWVYSITAILSGLGVGLFIDEVGKFITDNNNYFYPAAAPIIYGFFLLTVLLYFQVRRRRLNDTRSELYYALADLTEAIDRDLDTVEAARIQQLLIAVKNNSAYPEQSQLAIELLDYLHSNQVHIIDHRPNWLERQINRYKKFEAQYISRTLHRAILIAGALIFGVLALYDPLLVIALVRTSVNPAAPLLELHFIRTLNEFGWFALRLALEGAVGVLLLASAVLLAVKREKQGILFGSIGMLFYLLTVNLFVLYFDQFTFILVTVVEFGFYLGMVRYRQRFLPRAEAPAVMHHQ
jgi:hypothetical protein